MATENETDLVLSISGITKKLSEIASNPLPKYTIPGGATLDWQGYYDWLVGMRKKLREELLAEQGPFTVTSVVR